MEKEKKKLVTFNNLQLYHQNLSEATDDAIQKAMVNLVSFSEDKTFEGLEEVT